MIEIQPKISRTAQQVLRYTLDAGGRLDVRHNADALWIAWWDGIDAATFRRALRELEECGRIVISNETGSPVAEAI